MIGHFNLGSVPGQHIGDQPATFLDQRRIVGYQELWNGTFEYAGVDHNLKSAKVVSV